MAQFTIPLRNDTKEMRYQMGYALADLANEYPNIVAVDADLRSSSGLHIFEHFHPDKLVKVGIAEQNMISVSAGLSQEGFIPFPCTFDAFCRRFLDQLYISVAYSRANVKVLGAYVGLFTGKAGATHQSDKELGVLLRMPNLRVIEPGFHEEMRQALRAAVETPGPFYLRIVRCEVEDNEAGPDYRFQLGKGTPRPGLRRARCRASSAQGAPTIRLVVVSMPSRWACSMAWLTGRDSPKSSAVTISRLKRHLLSDSGNGKTPRPRAGAAWSSPSSASSPR